jgi:hypothetical protein
MNPIMKITGALALALALCGPARSADTETATTPIAGSSSEDDDSIWGEARDVFAALQRSRLRQVDAQFEEGDYLAENVELRPFPKNLLPALNPFSELDLHVVLSKREAAVVLPLTRRIVKVYRAPVDAAMQPRAAPPAAPDPVTLDTRATKAAPDPVALDARATKAAPDPVALDARATKAAPDPVALDARATKAAPEPARRAPSERAESAPAMPSAASDDNVVRTLLERAEARRKTGDILATRQFLEHASKLGSADALERLAETYDPKALAAWGALGVRADKAKAEKLYANANERRSRATLSARTNQRRENEAQP